MKYAATWMVGILSIIPFASFIWAIKRHFIRMGPMPRAMKALSVYSLVAYASYILLLVEHPDPYSIGRKFGGVVLFATAFVMFWWAIRATSTVRLSLAYHQNSATGVLITGPFDFVRHPFYFSYMLFWIGTAVTVGRWQWMSALVLVSWYVSIARAEERSLTTGKTALQYEAYRQRTGMFLPPMRRQHR